MPPKLRKKVAATKAAVKKALAKKPAAKKVKPRAPAGKLKERAAEIRARLDRAIPRPHVELTFHNPWELVVAVILSAQSTDRTVNRIMPEVLARWPDAKALAESDPDEVEKVIYPTGFFRNKTKSIRAMSRTLLDRFGGVLPRTMDEMLELPGVARKSANVVLAAVYGEAHGIVVDVHVSRVAPRLGLTKHTDPVKVEQALLALFPREAWRKIGPQLVLHGRYVCTAKKPACAICPLNELCPSAQDVPAGPWEHRADEEALGMESRVESFHRLD